MKKLYREVVVLPHNEHSMLLKLHRRMKVSKSKVFRLGLSKMAETMA
jgi:hypothetical protein